MKLRRNALKLLLFLLALCVGGAIINVAVVWGMCDVVNGNLRGEHESIER